jgi:hypothetical protein
MSESEKSKVFANIPKLHINLKEYLVAPLEGHVGQVALELEHIQQLLDAVRMNVGNVRSVL